VRIDRGLVAKALATTPSDFTFQALDPEFNAKVGGKHVCLAPTSGPPNIMDMHNGRRSGTFEDFCNLMKLCQTFDVIHTLGGAVEPQDIPVHLRHFETTRSMLLLSDKTPFIFSRGSQQIADCFELIRIAHQVSAEDFKRKPYVWTVINTNSPLQLDIPMAEGIIDFAEAGQVLIITPFTLAGAMAPVTIGCADACACRGARRHHARTERATGYADPLRQLHLERRHEVRVARFRHSGVRKGCVRRGPAGTLYQGAVAFVECDGVECARCAGRLRSADEPVGRADGRRQLHAARRRLGRRRPLDVL
jgi:trimethylamine:corrinoid methyltransferase-like protein